MTDLAIDTLPDIEGYTTKQLLSQTPNSLLYIANETKINRDVVLKVLLDDTLAQRFDYEARLLARLNHPNIVTIYDLGSIENGRYLSMQYYDGGNLTTRRKQRLTLRRALIFVRHIATALACAHHHDIIHRDIKPSNIVFDSSNDQPVISDFGIACDLSAAPMFSPFLDNAEERIRTAGTPTYMSPEQARGQTLDGRTDIYSLGVVLYELLIDHPPFRGEDAYNIAVKHCQAPVPPLPEELSICQNLMDKLLAKLVRYRFADAKAVIEEVDYLLDTYSKELKIQLPVKTKAEEELSINLTEDYTPLALNSSNPSTALHRTTKQDSEDISSIAIDKDNNIVTDSQDSGTSITTLDLSNLHWDYLSISFYMLTRGLFLISYIQKLQTCQFTPQYSFIDALKSQDSYNDDFVEISLSESESAEIDNKTQPHYLEVADTKEEIPADTDNLEVNNTEPTSLSDSTTVKDIEDTDASSSDYSAPTVSAIDDEPHSAQKDTGNITDKNTKHNHEPLKKPALFKGEYTEQDYQEGWLFNPTYSRTIKFSAPSFAAFKQAFYRSSVSINEFIRCYGKRGRYVYYEINAAGTLHEDIFNYMKNQCSVDQLGYRPFCQSKSVILTLIDTDEDISNTYTIRDKGKLPL